MHPCRGRLPSPAKVGEGLGVRDQRFKLRLIGKQNCPALTPGPSPAKVGEGSKQSGKQGAYSFTGDAGSSSKAITSRICCSVRMPLWPKRGMFEQALYAFESQILPHV